MLALPMEPPAEAEWRDLGSVAHVFTHFSLSLRVMAAEGDTNAPGEWWPVARIEDAGLPTVFAKAAALGLAE
jgi:A/G-specific adenine glycosylase